MATNTRKRSYTRTEVLEKLWIVSDSKEKHVVNINLSDPYSSRVLCTYHGQLDPDSG